MKRIAGILFFLLSGFLLSASPPVKSLNKDSLRIVGMKWSQENFSKGVVVRSAQFLKLFDSHQYVRIYHIDGSVPNTSFGLKVLYAHELKRVEKEHEAAMVIDVFEESGNKARPRCYVKTGMDVVNKTDPQDFIKSLNGAIRISGQKLHIMPWNANIEDSYDDFKDQIIASGPLLVHWNEQQELRDCDPELVNKRMRRNALGKDAQGNIMIVSVDQSENSAGMTLRELRTLMQALGCQDAINLGEGLLPNLEPSNGEACEANFYYFR